MNLHSTQQFNGHKLQEMYKRLDLKTADIQIIFGISYRQARRKKQHLKDVLEKEKHQCISIQEFCEYYALQENEVRKQIGAQ